MSGTLTASATIEIHASLRSVWNALITPASIKQYLFGTETECDWKKGSPIFFRGEYNGTKYEDKGTILEIEAEKILRYTYWSSMSGTPDIPENYAIVTYALSLKGNAAVLAIHQEGISSPEGKQHSEQNWGFVLMGIKKLVEGT